MKRLLLLACIVLAVVGLSGCSMSQGVAEAKTTAQAYYDTLKTRDFGSAMRFYSPKFFEITSQKDTLQLLESIDAKLGDLQSYKSTGWKVNSYAGTGGNYTLYVLSYDTTYAKGSAKETLTFVKSDDGTKMQIFGFYINSLDLIKN